MNSFGERLKIAFNNARNAEIARKLGLSEPAIKKYLDGSMPSIENLIQIKNLTGRSLDWLITGEETNSAKEFDLEYAIDNNEDWTQIIDKWYEFDGQENPMPDAMGASFMGGWQSFDRQQRIDAVKDFKAFLDRIRDKDRDHSSIRSRNLTSAGTTQNWMSGFSTNCVSGTGYAWN